MRGPKRRKPTKEEIAAIADRAEGKKPKRKAKPKDMDAPLPEPEELEEWPGGVTLPRKRGRPVYKYNPQYAIIAAAMCRKGCTMFEIAEAFDITVRHLYRWRAQYPDFDAALTELGQSYDSRIERTLAERAMGYSYRAVKIFQFQGNPVEVPYVEHVPPDVSAIKMWLSARQPERWRIKDEVEVSANDTFVEIWKGLSEKKGDS